MALDTENPAGACCDRCGLAYEVGPDGDPATSAPFTCDDCGGPVEPIAANEIAPPRSRRGHGPGCVRDEDGVVEDCLCPAGGDVDTTQAEAQAQ